MKTKEILTTTSNVLLEHGFNVTIDKNVTIFTKDALTEQLSEFIKLPTNETSSNNNSNKKARKSGDKKKTKSEINFSKQVNSKAENDGYNTSNESDELISKTLQNRKRKKKRTIGGSLSKLKKLDLSNNSVKDYRRRSQRCCRSKEASPKA